MQSAAPILHPLVFSQVIINFALSFGVDKEICLLGTGITDEQLLNSEALISKSQEMRLFENLIHALPNEPALGFKLGLQYNLSTFGVWGFALRTSRSLREAASVAIRYLPLSTAYCRMQLFQEGHLFGFTFDSTDVPIHLRQFLLERDVAISFNLMNELSLSGVKLSRLEIQGSPPSYTDVIKELLGIESIHNSPLNTIAITNIEANRLLPMFDSRLAHIMGDQCRQQLVLRNQTGVAAEVRQLIRRPLGFVSSADEIATALAVSTRSLRRKLESENTSFKLLLDDERQSMAKQLLSSSDMKLEELAFHLGYTDAASFSRAFRRWLGCSPGEYRMALSCD